MPEIKPFVAMSTPLRGVVPASYPALVGTVVLEASAEMPVERQPGFCSVDVRIVRSAMTGLLLFCYRLEVHGGDWNAPVGLEVMFLDHTAQITFADFRVDSAGVMPPNVVAVAANGDFTFRFDHGLRVGRGGRECFVATNAREFRETGGRLTVTAMGKSSVLNVPAPIGLPLKPVTVVAEGATDKNDNPCRELGTLCPSLCGILSHVDYGCFTLFLSDQRSPIEREDRRTWRPSGCFPSLCRTVRTAP